MKGRSVKYLLLIIGSLFGSHSASALPMVNDALKTQVKQVSGHSLIDLNRVSLNELIKIKGLGKSKAAAILAYRKKVGKFKTLSELKEIKGIGPKLFAKIKPQFKL